MRNRVLALVAVVAATAAAQVQPTITPNISSLGMNTGEPFNLQFGCAGTCPTFGLTWDITAGTLPTGTTFSAAGILSGTPSTSGQTGEFVVRLRQQLISSVGFSTVALRTYAFSVNPRPLFTTQNPLAAVTSGTTFTRTISANVPGLWSVSNSTLPTGVSFTFPPNGGTSMTLSGIFPLVTERQVYSFNVRFMTFSETTINATYLITVNPPISAGGTLAAGNAGVPYTGTLGIQGGTPPYSIVLATAGGVPPGLSLNPATGELTGTPTTQGSYGFVVRISDQGGGVGSGTYAMVINAPPITITSGQPPAGRVGENYSFRFFAQGPPTSAQGFLWAVNSGLLPDGLTLSVDGLVSGTPTREGTFRFTVRATAPNQNGSALGEYAIQILPRALAINGDPPPGSVGVNYSFTYTVTGGAQPYTFLLAGGSLPPGLSLNTNTGVLSGTPTTAGSSTFTVAVLDAQQQRATRNSTVTVTASLRFTTDTLDDAVVRSAYSMAIQATGGTAPLTFSVDGAAPAGLTLGGNGVLSGTPTTAGAATFLVRVTDGARQSITRSYTLQVRPPLAITTTALDRGVRGESFSANINATGGIPPYRFSVPQGPLPAGLALSAAGVLTGTPTAAGTSTFAVQVLDQRNNRAEQTYTFTVLNRPAITSTSLPGGAVGADYRATLTGTGTGALAWSASNLPPGLDLDRATGVISGRPTSGGSFTVNVQLSDTTPLTTTRQFTIVVDLNVPGVTITQVGDTVNPAQQPTFGITLAAPSPVNIRGTISLAHAAERGPADPNVRFANGQTTMDFNIPRGQTAGASAVANTPLAFQAGTVAGTITLTVVLRDADTNAALAPNPAATRTIRVNPAGPSITSVRINRTAAGFEVLVTGFSNTREITGATFRFAAAPGSQLGTADVNVPVQDAFQRWFTSADSTATGAQFLLTMPFTVQGGAAANLASVQVTLTNSVGNTSGSAAF